MAVAMYMQFPNGTREQYEGVVKALNLKTKTPAGLLHHVAGPLESGWCVMDVWESQAHFDGFFKEGLQKALQDVKLSPPQVKTINVYNTMGQAAMAGR